jgi:uncharacterized protein YaaN involved in tellurite resistance
MSSANAISTTSYALINPRINKEEINTIIENLDINNGSLSISYGTEAMEDIATFSNNLLQNVRIGQTGEIGNKLINIMAEIQGVNIKNLQKTSIFKKLPFIGHLFDKTQQIIASFNTVNDQIDKIADNLNVSFLELIKDVEILDQLYKHNEDYYYKVCTYIEAGKQYINKIKETEVSNLQKEYENQKYDYMLAQQLKDLQDKIDRFEKRLNDLEISKSIAIQTAPQIRIIQNNNQSLAEKIQSSLLSTIPIWKSQLVLALSIDHQKQAAHMSSVVTKTTNELLSSNATMLKQNSIDIARQSQESIVDINTLKEVHEKLISTIQETIKIAEDAKSKRYTISKELEELENNLTKKLLQIHENEQKKIK